MFLVHVPKVWVLLVRQIIKSVRKILIIRFGHLLLQLAFVLVAEHEVETQECDYNDQEYVTAHVGREGDEVAGCVP